MNSFKKLWLCLKKIDLCGIIKVRKDGKTN